MFLSLSGLILVKPDKLPCWFFFLLVPHSLWHHQWLDQFSGNTQFPSSLSRRTTCPGQVNCTARAMSSFDFWHNFFFRSVPFGPLPSGSLIKSFKAFSLGSCWSVWCFLVLTHWSSLSLILSQCHSAHLTVCVERKLRCVGHERKSSRHLFCSSCSTHSGPHLFLSTLPTSRRHTFKLTFGPCRSTVRDEQHQMNKRPEHDWVYIHKSYTCTLLIEMFSMQDDAHLIKSSKKLDLYCVFTVSRNHVC